MITLREKLGLLIAGWIIVAACMLFPGPLYYYDAHVLVPELYAGQLGGATLHRNILYLPLGHLLCFATGWAPEDALALLSALAAAATPIAIYVALRRFGYASLPSAMAAFLVLSAPHVLFFALHIEKHGPHLAACAIALAIAARRPEEDTRWRAVLAPLLAVLLVCGTHASGLLRWPFLAWIGYERSRGARRWMWALSGGGAAAVCAACVVFFVGFRQGWWQLDDSSPAYGLLINVISHWNFDPRGILRYVELTMIPGGIVLLPLGVLGALLAWREHRRVSLPLLAWLLCDLYAYAAYGWVKMGGHVLATYVALSLGTAECVRRIAKQRAAIAMPILLALLALQGYFGLRLACADADQPHPLHWSRDLRLATADRGTLITDWQAHYTLCKLHSQLLPLSLAQVGFVPIEQRSMALTALGDWIAAQLEAGMPVFLDAYLDALCSENPELRTCLQSLRERFLLEDVSQGRFHGWRFVRSLAH